MSVEVETMKEEDEEYVDIEAVSAFYTAIKDLTFSSNKLLDQIGKVSALTVAAGFRNFAYLEEEGLDVQTVQAALESHGLFCNSDIRLWLAEPGTGVERLVGRKQLSGSEEMFAKFDACPRDKIFVFESAEERDYFVDNEGPTSKELGVYLDFPECCVGANGKYLANHKKGSRATDKTFLTFPAVIHVACQDCLRHGAESPSGELNASYIALMEAVAPDLLKSLAREKNSIVPAVQRLVVDKVGRNDPCLCGSGLKYKKCCGKA